MHQMLVLKEKVKFYFLINPSWIIIEIFTVAREDNKSNSFSIIKNQLINKQQQWYLGIFFFPKYGDQLKSYA